jgi:hypothetical protein
MLEAAKDRVFVAPASPSCYAMLNEAEPWGITREKAVEMGYQTSGTPRSTRCRRCTSAASASCPAATTASRSRRTARTRATSSSSSSYLGFTPMEAIRSPRCYGGQIMMQPNELGVVKDG